MQRDAVAVATLAAEAADLGGHGFFAFRTVTLPTLSTALVSGSLLAFALSFDEVIVTTFTSGAQNTLPLWIFGAIRLGQNLPEVNVVVSVLLLTIVPVVIAARLTGDGGITRGLAQNLRLGPVNQLMRAVPMAVKNGTVLARAPDRLVPACSSGMAPCSSGNAAARRVPAPVAASRMPAGARRSAADVALPAGARPGMSPWPGRAVLARALPRAR